VLCHLQKIVAVPSSSGAAKWFLALTSCFGGSPVTRKRKSLRIYNTSQELTLADLGITQPFRLVMFKDDQPRVAVPRNPGLEGTSLRDNKSGRNHFSMASSFSTSATISRKSSTTASSSVIGFAG